MIVWLAVALIVCAGSLIVGWQLGLYRSDVCPVTRRPHDYHERNGGDGTPSHFYTYTCSYCGKQFSDLAKGHHRDR